MQQECIPVGCVLPATVAVPGGRVHPRSRHPREQTPPPGSRHPPGRSTPLLTESQTPVKILPCPNLWAVMRLVCLVQDDSSLSVIKGTVTVQMKEKENRTMTRFKPELYVKVNTRIEIPQCARFLLQFTCSQCTLQVNVSVQDSCLRM